MAHGALRTARPGSGHSSCQEPAPWRPPSVMAMMGQGPSGLSKQVEILLAVLEQAPVVYIVQLVHSMSSWERNFFLWTRKLKLPKEKTVSRTSSAAICEDSSQPRKNIIVNGKSHPYLQVVDVTNMTCVFNKNSLWFCDRRKKKKRNITRKGTSFALGRFLISYWAFCLNPAYQSLAINTGNLLVLLRNSILLASNNDLIYSKKKKNHQFFWFSSSGITLKSSSLTSVLIPNILTLKVL